MSKPVTTIETITPTQAAKWLSPSVNRDNRPIRDSHVEFLAQQILGGNWQTTHQGIGFADDGRLLDGQHRLSAIVRANRQVQMMVTRGLSEEAFKVVDCGLKRATADRIHLVNDQRQNITICQAISQYLWCTSLRASAIPASAVEDEFLRMADAWQWIGTEFVGLSPKLRRAQVLASFAVYRFVKPELAAECAEGFKTGTDLSTDSPILRLRNQSLGVEGSSTMTYWRAQACMRAHMHGKRLTYVTAAAEDMMGCKNSTRLINERAKARGKGEKKADRRKTA